MDNDLALAVPTDCTSLKSTKCPLRAEPKTVELDDHLEPEIVSLLPDQRE
jgi:hypothetical protein